MAEYLNEKYEVPEHRLIPGTPRPYFEGREDIVKETASGMTDPKNDGHWDESGSSIVMKALWPLPNVWLGTSVEDQQRADERIPHLLKCPAAVRFLSVEPLLGPVKLRDPHAEFGDGSMADLTNAPDGWDFPDGIDWAIVGGESGPNSRPCDVDWIRSIVRQCKASGVSCFVKQLGANVFDSSLSDIWFDGKLRHRGVPDNGSKAAYARGCLGTELQPALIKLNDKKGGDMSEWPIPLRVREMPKGVTK